MIVDTRALRYREGRSQCQRGAEGNPARHLRRLQQRALSAENGLRLSAQRRDAPPVRRNDHPGGGLTSHGPDGAV
jgi:hypothetical protein